MATIAGVFMTASLLLIGGTSAFAQSPGDDPTIRRAEEIVSQPVRDMGIAKRQVPPVLLRAAADPYATPAEHWCRGLALEQVELDAVLGTDFTESRATESRAGQIAATGGEMLVNAMIPFRGLVREVSGAAPAERRLAAAVKAGVARRGYLRGLQEARGCIGPRLAYRFEP